MNIPFAIVLGYIIVLFFISWYSTRLAREAGILGYLLAGRGLPFSIVAASRLHGLEHASMALPWTVLNFNPFIAGLTLAGLWAADISTATGLLLGCTTLIVTDIWKKFLHPGISGKQELLVSRITVLAVSLIT